MTLLETFLILLFSAYLILQCIGVSINSTSEWYCTMRGGNKRLDCDSLKFIRQGIDTCWVDTSMYILIIPQESFKLIAPRLYRTPVLANYTKILRDKKWAPINRCTPGGGNEIILLEKTIKTLGLSILCTCPPCSTRNIRKITKDYPHYILRPIVTSRKMGIRAKMENITSYFGKYHKLIALLFHIEYVHTKVGHVACAVLCESRFWRYYNNCNHSVLDIHERKIEKVAKIIINKIEHCPTYGGGGYGSR